MAPVLQADLQAWSGKAMTAEMLYRQSIDIYRDSLGTTCPYILARAVYSLAVFYQKQTKLVVSLVLFILFGI